MHSGHSLALDGNWDVFLNESGNIATTAGDMAIAQDVANECRLFAKDAYFDHDKGIPHKLVELGGKNPPTPLLRTLMRRAALRVPDVVEVLGVEFGGFDKDKRLLTGSITVRTRRGSDVLVAL
jgi:hypothetical protein